MEAFAELILSNEPWILERAVNSAVQHEVMLDLAPPPQAWQMAYTGLRDVLLQHLFTANADSPLPGPRRHVDDTALTTVTATVQRHVVRGVTVGQFAIQLKIFRDCFIALLDHADSCGITNLDVKQVQRSVLGFFDALEVAIFSDQADKDGSEMLREMRNANLQLTREKNKYLVFFESQHDAAALLDQDGYVVNVNHSFISQFSLPANAVANDNEPARRWRIDWLKDELADLQASTLDERRFIKQLQTAAGERSFDVKLKVVCNTGERFVTTLVLLVDVTEREQFETELKREKERAQNYLDIAGAIIVALDRDGNVSMLNRVGRQLLGYADQEILGLNWFDLVVPDSERNDVLTVFQAIMAGRVEVHSVNENRILARDGRLLSIAWYNTVLRDNMGHIIGTLSSGLDVTARRRAEIELSKRARALEDINEEIRNFAYIVSHDLKTPLVNVRGYSRELRRAIDEIRALLSIDNDATGHYQIIKRIIDDDIVEALSFIDSSVTRIDKFNNAVLHLSRAGRNPLCFETVDPHRIVGDVLQSLAHELESCGARIEIRPLPLFVCDATSLEQIFSNLLSNAVKYRHNTRSLCIEISAQESDHDIVFAVADNGTGIDPGAWSKIFLPFRRAVGDEIPGEGMGLAYVRALVRKLEGTVWFETEPGVGSTFFFSVARQQKIGTLERGEI